MNNLYFVIGAAIVAIGYSLWKTKWIEAQDEGSDRMKSIGKSIADGAMAFLNAEYRILIIFVIIIAIVLGIANNDRVDSSILISLSFIVGAVASGLSGFWVPIPCISISKFGCILRVVYVVLF